MVRIGYLQNRKGEEIPVSAIKTKDIIRNDWVNKMIDKAKQTHKMTDDLIREALTGMEDLEALLAQDYDVVMRKSSKGNRSITSYDGKFKVERESRDITTFDEQIHIAKELIDQCLADWTDDSRKEIKVIILDAFNVDKKGRMNIQRIKDLRKYDFEDERWTKAMEIIADAETFVQSCSSVHFYQRQDLKSDWVRIM